MPNPYSWILKTDMRELPLKPALNVEIKPMRCVPTLDIQRRILKKPHHKVHTGDGEAGRWLQLRYFTKWCGARGNTRIVIATSLRFQQRRASEAEARYSRPIDP